MLSRSDYIYSETAHLDDAAERELGQRQANSDWLTRFAGPSRCVLCHDPEDMGDYYLVSEEACESCHPEDVRVFTLQFGVTEFDGSATDLVEALCGVLEQYEDWNEHLQGIGIPLPVRTD